MSTPIIVALIIIIVERVMTNKKYLFRAHFQANLLTTVLFFSVLIVLKSSDNNKHYQPHAYSHLTLDKDNNKSWARKKEKRRNNNNIVKWFHISQTVFEQKKILSASSLTHTHTHTHAHTQTHTLSLFLSLSSHTLKQSKLNFIRSRFEIVK